MSTAAYPTRLVALGVAALASLVLLACGGERSTAAFAELQRIAAITPGQPVLVFIYTDG